MDGEEGRRREEVGKREREGGKEGEGERKQTLALRKKFSKPHSNHNLKNIVHLKLFYVFCKQTSSVALLFFCAVSAIFNMQRDYE